ncbi:protein APCDD1 [Aplysia californica]|uniref:Protein APCDD1 n=1 Tax=Aplysia californica TaxID=6500 RepID=A0ABM1A6F9_APLCA|nr:protein APCDD1 [Aplysia californica]
MWTFLAVLQICGVLTVVLASSPRFVYREEWHETSCARALQRLRHRPVEILSPPVLDGQWVSHRCEIRSGPEYVIRHFRFQNGTFESVVYRYSDPECHHPLYAIQSRGTHQLLRPSWTVQGGTEADYVVTSAYVIPYTTGAVREMSSKLAIGCRDILAEKFLKRYSKYLIYSLPPTHEEKLKLQASASKDKNTKKDEHRDIDCFAAVNFTLHELQLVMVEAKSSRDHRDHRHSHQRHRFHPQLPNSFSETDNSSISQPQLQNKKHHEHRLHKPHNLGNQEHQGAVPEGGERDGAVSERELELLLGAVHSRPKDRQGHRPSSYQTALKNANTPGCGVCARIASSGPLSPPRLSSHTGTLLSLQGEWVSTRCESRQYGMFLTRWLGFLPDGVSWQGQYDYYHDSLCHKPSFSLDAKGSYAGGTSSHLVQGAKDFSFRVTRLKVTPHDSATADSMNHYSGKGCGRAHEWKVGQEQDVTWTGGCVTLGIRLPNMERDIMKMEMVHRKLLLYVGQRLVDKKPGTGYQHERPTAFQEPMVKCDQVDLDMSINTAPGGHSWVGGIALPLSAGPVGDDTKGPKNGATSAHLYQTPFQCFIVMSLYLLYSMN